MSDPVIRPKNVAVLLKLETIEAVDAGPSALLDAIPVEADSVVYNSPFKVDQSNEATGSLVAGAPLVVGQPATVTCRSRLKGAGNGIAYTADVKPPLHQALQACGKRGQFMAAIVAAAFTAGGLGYAVLGAGFAATAQSYVGMPLVMTGGVGAGHSPLIASYSAGKMATLSEGFGTALDGTTSGAIPANWTYAGTSPRDASSRISDQPSATIYIYEDGTLLKFIGCRGVVELTGQTAKPGYGEFNFSGIFAGKTDAALPSNLVIANHQAPTLVQGADLTPAVTLARRPLPISQWSLKNGGDAIESPEDPNTLQGFGAGSINGRIPLLAMDPLATTVAARNMIASISAGTSMIAAIRAGAIAGNRWALTIGTGQPVSADPGTRGSLRSEQIGVQALSNGLDAYLRDTESVLCFY